MTWQPIESAPKDGTDVLLFVPGFRCSVRIGHWHDSETLQFGKSVSKQSYWSIGVMIFGDNPVPTHWQPLPDPPVQS